jgi:hypothetical protein
MISLLGKFQFMNDEHGHGNDKKHNGPRLDNSSEQCGKVYTYSDPANGQDVPTTAEDDLQAVEHP